MKVDAVDQGAIDIEDCSGRLNEGWNRASHGKRTRLSVKGYGVRIVAALKCVMRMPRVARPEMDAFRMGATGLLGFVALYVALYAAYGTESAYMPAFVLSHGLPVEKIGLVFALGSVIRILSGTALGRLADRRRVRKRVLAISAALSGLIGWAYLGAYGFAPLLGVTVVSAAATSSLSPLSDALAVGAASDGRNFQYGWVRGVGSLAFVFGTLSSGQLIDRFGLSSIIVASSILFLAMAGCTAWITEPPGDINAPDATSGELRTLWAIAPYRRLIFIVSLVIGSHALNDTFAVISWRSAGYSSATISLLWSESVLAEVAVFFLLGPWLLVRLGAARCAGVATAAGVVRWSIMGSTTWMPALLCTQALHGLTFALMHLAAMQVISISVSQRLSATAQAFYGTFALGVASAALTFASGYLYGGLGIHAFWAMALLCAAAFPITNGLVMIQAVSACKKTPMA